MGIATHPMRQAGYAWFLCPQTNDPRSERLFFRGTCWKSRLFPCSLSFFSTSKKAGDFSWSTKTFSCSVCMATLPESIAQEFRLQDPPNNNERPTAPLPPGSRRQSALPSPRRRLPSFGERSIAFIISQYITGDTPGVSDWVDRQPNRWAVFLRFVESVFRAFGTLIFVNNVWSGVLFCLACLIHNQFSTLLGIMGIVVSIFLNVLMNAPADLIRSGVATFNAFMVASFVGAHAMPFVPGTVWNAWLIFPALFFAVAV